MKMRCIGLVPVVSTFATGIINRSRVAAIILSLLGFLGAYRSDAGVTFTNIFTFSGTNGEGPIGSLIQARDGNLYGVTSGGGAYGYGTVFRIGLEGTFTNLVSLDNTNGSYPHDGLVEGADGSLFGTAEHGGSYDLGTVYKVTAEGMLTTVVDFNGTNGNYPAAALMRASDGNFYGTTMFGGAYPGLPPIWTARGGGTVFRISPTGTFETVVSFQTTNLLGVAPQASLMQASDGNLYGTTSAGGPLSNNYGSQGAVFKLTIDGQISLLAAFDGTNGGMPQFPLVEGTDGNLYGASYGGPIQGPLGGIGNFFRVSKDGAITNLYSFSGTNGAYPRGLARCADGNFYGLSGIGGPNAKGDGYDGPGNIFKMTPEGRITILVTFDGTNGGHPFCGMVQASDGNLYGTTLGNSIFRLSLPLPAEFKSIHKGEGATVLTWSAVASQKYQVQYRTNAFEGDWVNLGDQVTATNGIMTTLDTVEDSERFYRVRTLP